MNSPTVIFGYNDLYTLRPDLVKYFKDKELTKRIRVHSSKVVDLVCPDCKKPKRMKVYQLSNGGFHCNYCSDGISYPNKFIYSVLKQLNIDYQPEYSPSWIGNMRYDVYFELGVDKYIIEMDGGWHYKYNNLTGMTPEEQQSIDVKKEKIATEHNIKVIRMDSKKSDKEYIKNNILNSILFVLFDLSVVDWNECERNACKSYMYEICKYYNEHNSLTREELINVFKVSKNTIALYLQRGAELGICNYKKITDKAIENYNKTIDLFNNNPKLSINELSELIGVNRNMISKYLKDGTKEGLCLYLTRKEQKEKNKEIIERLISENPNILISDIIKITGIPATTARRICKELCYG
mgnify:CR=1 FL=1